MRKVTNRKSTTLILLALLCFLAFTPLQSSAALVWSETFDELNPEVWTTLLACRLEDGALRGVDGDHISAVRAYRPSNVSVGTWKFDLTEFHNFGEELDICKIYFIKPEESDYSSYYSLSLVHAGGEEGERYSYTLEKYIEGIPKVILDTHIGQAKPTMIGVLQQFAITRSADGQMAVYLNSSLILHAVDTDISTSEYFGFYTWDDWAFDNVYVYDTIEIGGNAIPLVIGVASVAVIVIAVIGIIRKR
ncbi:MAG: hypothetical protein ACFFDV_09650 [Candidatus Thorarchaeota archaeon]